MRLNFFDYDKSAIPLTGENRWLADASRSGLNAVSS
jgi:hypothetical protein